MKEERLQEIKDSISLQYKVQEANDLNNFNIFTDEEQELVEEIERLNNIINELEKFMDKDYEYYEKYGYAEQGHAMGQIRRIKNKLQELKGSGKE